MKITLTGTGSVKACPVYGCRCCACLKAQREQRGRAPAAAVIKCAGLTLPIDAGGDLIRSYPAGSIEHLLLTHFHMDHVHGLFPLRWGEGLRINVYAPADPLGCDDLLKHPGILDFTTQSKAFEPFTIGALTITPLPLNHSRPCLGYLVDNGHHRLAYLTDTIGLPAATLTHLQKQPVDLMVLDCSHPPHDADTGYSNNHNNWEQALRIHEQIQSKCTWLTHIGHELDRWLIECDPTLPDGLFIAKDGDSWEAN